MSQASHTGKLLGLLSGHSPEVPQIALVSDKHDDDVAIRVISELLQPPRDILVSLVLADIVDEEGTDGATVVGRGDGAVTFLAGSVPDLGLDCFGIDLNATGSEFDADGRLAVKVELVAGETREQVGLSNTAVSYQDHYRRESG